ncbi:MAG TPA: LamG domain-containing protein, partial [Polyangia bacterium]|nr:LamG domain-containing protein [Polyangia bacterium]
GGRPSTGGTGGTSTGGTGGTGTGGTGGTAGKAGTGGAGGQSLPPLFAYYPFDQTAGPSIPDATGNGHDGTLAGTATFPAGVIGDALDLPGAAADYVTLPSALLQTLTSVTIAVWVNVHTDHAWQRVFDFGSSTNVYMFFTPHNGTSNVARFAITTSGNSSTSEQRLDAAAILPVGTWTHVAIVLGTGGGTLYINGAAVATNAALTLRPSDLGATTNDWLGRSQFTPDPAFDGQLDDLRIYASALSAAQITTIFAAR